MMTDSYSELIKKTVLENISEGVVQLNEKFEIEDLNAKAEELCECQKLFALNKPVQAILSLFDEKSQTSIPFNEKNARLQSQAVDHILVNHLGHQRLVKTFFCVLEDESKAIKGYLFIFKDITENDLDHMQWQSSHDNLTGLVNRAELEERLENSLANVKTNNILSVFLLIDIDQFKIVNQVCGHKAGDEYLQQITLQIIKQLRTRDTLARIGGNEFGILLENCRLDDAAMIANKIKTAIKSYCFSWNQKEFNLTASIGLLGLNANMKNISKVIRDAESACALAKSKGGDAIKIHVKSDPQLAEQRHQLSIITEINNALENRLFRLYFQPIYSVKKEKISHWEVLLRLIDHNGNILMPKNFLPAAEKYGLIAKVDSWVFDNVVTVMKKIKKSQCVMPTLAINLSPGSLEDKNARTNIVNVLKKTKALHNQLIFEITETSALSNIEFINDYLRELKQFGCLLALDDFGTGVSTYSYLKSLDIDMIKIDGEFIETIAHNKVNQEIVHSLTKIAQLMGITTTAEWVCDENVFNYLNHLDMDYYQGYFIGKPVPEDVFINYLATDDDELLK